MKGRILVVDDDQSMCELIEADLNRPVFRYPGTPPQMRRSGYCRIRNST